VSLALKIADTATVAGPCLEIAGQARREYAVYTRRGPRVQARFRTLKEINVHDASIGDGETKVPI